jgi:serine/threonine protein kinase
MSCQVDDRSRDFTSPPAPATPLEPLLTTNISVSMTTKHHNNHVTLKEPAQPQHASHGHSAKRGRTSSSSVGGFWEPDEHEIRALTMVDFDIMGVLGVGTYGVVKLARHLRSGASVALKVLSKEHVVSMRQEKHILRERTVHIRLRHPFIARLFGTFQDEDCLYLVIEYLPGGELWSVVYSDFESEHSGDFDEEVDDTFKDDKGVSKTKTLGDGAGSFSPTLLSPLSSPSPPASPARTPGSPMPVRLDPRSRVLLRNRFGGLQEDHAAFYLACILCALEYLHAEDMLYRDLKLENLVLDRKGYPKVLDFGFAKPNAATSAKNMTLCGSMDYMAPEIVLHEPHDARADIWSFGIIMYELLLGKTPFYHDNPRELGRKITTDPVTFPNDFEQEYPVACDLIGRLLVKTVDERVRTMEEIKRHEFFTRRFPDEAAWQRLLEKRRPSPFVPKLSGPFDTSFFQRIDEEDDPEPYYEDGSNVFGEF